MRATALSGVQVVAMPVFGIKLASCEPVYWVVVRAPRVKNAIWSARISAVPSDGSTDWFAPKEFTSTCCSTMNALRGRLAKSARTCCSMAVAV